MAHYNTESLCLRCKNLVPALDANIRKAYLGKCRKREWPFSLMLPLHNPWTQPGAGPQPPHCEAFEGTGGPAYVPPDPAAVATKAEAATTTAQRRYEFYYSTTAKPGEMFPCDIAKAQQLLKQLQAKGVDVTIVDVATVKDRFPIYHRTVSGPDASVRPVFGFKGALCEDFGTSVPALLVFEGDRYPIIAFPRNDAARGLIGCEQALQDALA